MKQPNALKICFLTEMWERFGFYTVQAMLVFYMIDRFAFSDADAYAVLGQFTALVYLGPVVGGWASDRYLGNRFSIILGAIFLCFGYFLLALDNHTLFAGLSSVVIGNSLLKPNISSFLGQFYIQDDPRREAGFTLFYVGINVGGVLATTAGYTRELAGWSACFGVASFVLLLAIAFFRWGYRYFEDKGLPPNIQTHTLGLYLRQRPSIFLWLCGALSVIYFSLTSIGFGSYGLYFSGLLFCACVAKISLSLDAAARRRIVALLLLFVVVTVFFALWFQIFFVVNVFTDRAVDRTIWGYHIPPSVFVGLDSAFVLILGPILASIWKSKTNRLSVPAKFAFGIFLLGCSMQMLAWVVGDSSVLLPAIWLFIFYFGVTFGEMLISPIGLSMVTEYSPKDHTSLMMGGFFMAIGFGGKVTGILAGYASVPQGVTDLKMLNVIYQHAFQQYAWLAFIVAAICFAFVPLIRKWLKHS